LDHRASRRRCPQCGAPIDPMDRASQKVNGRKGFLHGQRT
jgi:hypothetical protein